MPLVKLMPATPPFGVFQACRKQNDEHQGARIVRHQEHEIATLDHLAKRNGIPAEPAQKSNGGRELLDFLYRRFFTQVVYKLHTLPIYKNAKRDTRPLPLYATDIETIRFLIWIIFVPQMHIDGISRSHPF